MNLRRELENAARVVSQALRQPGLEAAAVLRLSKELRALAREIRATGEAPKDERMASLARRRHAAKAAEPMRSACENDAQGMRSACVADAKTHAETMRGACVAHAAEHAPRVRARVTSDSSSPVQVQEKKEDSSTEDRGSGGKETANAVSENAHALRTVSACEDDAEPHAKRVRVDRPDDVPAEVWRDWLQVRKAKKAAVTETALAAIRREAQAAGMTLAEALTMAAAQGWQGFRADWAVAGRPGGASPPHIVPKSIPVGSYLQPGEDPVQTL
jgi:hypothetical protein